MYGLWMLVVLVGVSHTSVVRRGEAAASEVAFPLYKLREVLGQAVTTPRGRRWAISSMLFSTRARASSSIVS